MGRPKSHIEKTRVSLYLPATTAATIQEAAKLAGVSQTALIQSVIDGAGSDKWALLFSAAQEQGCTIGAALSHILDA